MRVTNIELYSERLTEPISFSVRDSDPTARYQARNIVGLDAEEIVRRFYGWGNNTNQKFYDYNLSPRDIVMQIALSPNFKLDEEYSDIRDELYRTISSERGGRVALHFKSGGTTVSRIYGYISKFEVPYFSKLPQVQMTVHCDDPIFRAINPMSLSAADLGSANPLVIADSLSTAPHGFVMEATYTATSPYFAIQDVASSPEWQFKVTPSGGFLVGDQLFISTEFANRYVYMIRSGVTTQLLDKLTPGSIWPTIFPGSNTLYFYDKTKFSWNLFEHYAAYWGV